MRVLVLGSVVFLTGCFATSGEPAGQSAAASQAADALPPMLPVEELGSSDVHRPITGNCGMENLQQYLGRQRTSVSRDVLPDNFRVLGPDMMTTMEFRADRLTIRIDRYDRIESITCG